jgi:Fe-S oxidoreductase
MISNNNHRSHNATKVLQRFEKKLNRQIVGSLVACVHCGMCTESCHYVLANPGDPTYAPAYKADQIRKLFKRHFDWTGRVLPWWVKAKSVYTDEELEQLKDTVFGKCTNCRRCSLNCPMGVDLATFNRMARGLLVSVGIMPEGVAVVSKDQWEIGNQMGVLKEDYIDTLEWLSDELEMEFGDPKARIPIDKMNADVVYSINPREVKYDPRTISDAAKIFYLAGENWTMPSEGWDMTNFGLFSGDDDLGGAVARRLFEKVSELGGKKLVISECGHGYRSTRCEGQNWAKWDIDFDMESSVITMLRYIKEGRIQVDKSKNTEAVTFHDSCNNARSCGLIEEPRELINLVASDFREMYPNRTENYCCTGGGGAMSMSEYTPRRLKSAKIKADQLKATGAAYVATSCHNCVDGLTDLIRHYKLGMKVTQLVNLVAEAAVVPARVVVPVTEEPVMAKGMFDGLKILVADDTVAELARRESPDLITLDIQMPGMTGEEVFAELRAQKDLKGIPVCIITGRPELRKLIYDRHVPPPEGYIDKPITEETLLLNLRKVLKLAHEPESARKS